MLNGYLWVVLMVGLTINPIFVYAESGILAGAQQQTLLDDNVAIANTVDTVSDSHDVDDVGSKLSWPKSLFSLGLMLYVSRKLTSLVHECGHGVTALVLGEKVVQWNLKPILFGGGPPSVGIIPPSSVLNNLLISMAGPIAGISAALLLGKISAMLCRNFLPKNKDNETDYEAYVKLIETYVSFRIALGQFSNLDPVVVERNGQTFLSDGQYIYECLSKLVPPLASIYKDVVAVGYLGLLGYSAYRIYKAGKEFYTANKQSATPEAAVA